MATSRADPGVIVGLRPRLCRSRNALAPRGPIRPLNRKYDQGVNHITAHSCGFGYRREVGPCGRLSRSEPSGTRRRASCPAQIACWCSRPRRRRIRVVSSTPCPRRRCRGPAASGTWMNLRGTSGITNGDRTFASAAATTTSILAGAMAICTIRATMRLTTSSGSRSPAAASGQRRLRSACCRRWPSTTCCDASTISQRFPVVATSAPH
jgi:hypothetical protein